jgi:prepilin-type processing-associated H-X9-DG protein
MLPYALAHDNPPSDIGPSGQSYYLHTNLCGQYLEVEFKTDEYWDKFKGPAKLFRCPIDRQSGPIPNSPLFKFYPSYGLNDKFCPSVPPSSNVNYADAWKACTTLPQIRAQGRVGIITDIAGDLRFNPGWEDPPSCPAFGDVNKIADWAVTELYPDRWVPRHRKGANVGFLDGHVRYSPSLTAESLAKTILFAPWTTP